MEKMFTLKGNRLPAADVKNIIFLVRPRLELMDIIAENVLRYIRVLRFKRSWALKRFFTLMYFGDGCVPWCLCGGQKSTGRNGFSSPTEVPGIGLIRFGGRCFSLLNFSCPEVVFMVTLML